MNLDEIETKAEELIAGLLGTPSLSNAELYGRKIQGLKDLALIKATVQGEYWNNIHTGLRTRELEAMELAAEKIPSPPLPACGKASLSGADLCALPEGHEGRHNSGGIAPASWPAEKCGYRWEWGVPGEPLHKEICTLDHGHEGRHFNRVTEVESESRNS